MKQYRIDSQSPKGGWSCTLISIHFWWALNKPCPSLPNVEVNLPSSAVFFLTPHHYEVMFIKEWSIESNGSLNHSVQLNPRL